MTPAVRRAGAITPLVRSLLLILLVLAIVPARSLVPVPAPPQGEPIALVGATVHVGNGTVIRNGTVAFADGRITGVGTDVNVHGHRVVDVSGRHVYPGFILLDTRLGLVEVNAVRATADFDEIGALDPNVRSIVAYNTDSELIPSLRFNGILLAQVAPEGGLVSGSSSVVRLDGWNWADAVLRTDDAVFLNWPRQWQQRFDFSTFSVRYEKNEARDAQVQALEQLFRDARTYPDRPETTPANLKLAAMQGLFDGRQALFVRAGAPRDVVAAVERARAAGVQRLVVVGTDALLPAAEYLAEHDVGALVMDPHRLPGQPHHDLHQPYRLAAKLVDAGVTTAISVSNLTNFARNLAFQAGTVSAWSDLDREQALRLITLAPAQMLGLADRVGSVAVGKDATLFVSTGDALDMRGNDITQAYIDGRAIDLEGMQQELYQRYREKYDGDTPER